MKEFIIILLLQLSISELSEAQDYSRLVAVESWGFSEMYVTPAGGVFLFDSKDTVLWYKNPGESSWNRAWIPDYHSNETFDCGYEYSINCILPFIQNKMGLFRGNSWSNGKFSYCFGPHAMKQIQKDFPLLLYEKSSDSAFFKYVHNPEGLCWGYLGNLRREEMNRIYSWLKSHETVKGEENYSEEVSGMLVNPASLFNPEKPSETALFKSGIRKYYYNWVRHAFFYKFRDTTFFEDSPSHLVIRDSSVFTEIPFQVGGILLDPKSNHVFALSGDNNIYRFFGPDSFIRLNKTPSPANINATCVANGSVYLVAGANELYLYQINDSVFKRELMLYDSGPLIPNDSIYHCNRKQYSILHSAVICSEDNGHSWFREKFLPVKCRKQMQLNDSVVLIQTGSRPSYPLNTYCFATGDFQPYVNDNPLGEFLKFPIEKIEISICQHFEHGESPIVDYRSNNIKLLYEKDSDRNLTLKNTNFMVNSVDIVFNKNITQTNLASALKMLNRIRNDSIIDIQSLEINQHDKQQYISEFFSRETLANYYEPYSVSQDSLFYKSIEWESMNYVSTQVVSGSKNHSKTIFIQMTFFNEAGNKVSIVNGSTNLFALPWTISYNGMEYCSYNIDFSLFFKSIIPSESVSSMFFDNYEIMLNIADFLYRQRQIADENKLH